MWLIRLGFGQQIWVKHTTPNTDMGGKLLNQMRSLPSSYYSSVKMALVSENTKRCNSLQHHSAASWFEQQHNFVTRTAAT